MTKQFQVLLAVKALVQAALPTAEIRGFDQDAARPDTIGTGGCVIGDPGDPGEPEIDLSPLAYNYEHAIAIELAAPGGAGGATLDGMLEPIGAAIAADRTLGGLCEYLDVTAPDRGSGTGQAVASINWAAFSIVATYSTSNPLA